MSKKINDYVIDGVIQSIRATLHKHTGHYTRESISSARVSTPDLYENSNVVDYQDSNLRGVRHTRVSSSIEPGWSSRPLSSFQSPSVTPPPMFTEDSYDNHVDFRSSVISCDSLSKLTPRLDTIPNENFDITFKKQETKEYEDSRSLMSNLKDKNCELERIIEGKEKEIRNFEYKLKETLNDFEKQKHES